MPATVRMAIIPPTSSQFSASIEATACPGPAAALPAAITSSTWMRVPAAAASATRLWDNRLAPASTRTLPVGDRATSARPSRSHRRTILPGTRS